MFPHISVKTPYFMVSYALTPPFILSVKTPQIILIFETINWFRMYTNITKYNNMVTSLLLIACITPVYINI